MNFLSFQQAYLFSPPLQRSFEVFKGEFLGIIGHTGSGKSTLMQQLNGLLKPTKGTVLLGGKDIWSDKKFTRQCRFRVGLVFQYPEYQLFEETADFPRCTYGKSKAKAISFASFRTSGCGLRDEVTIVIELSVL